MKQKIKICHYPIIMVGFLMFLNTCVNAQKIKYKSKVEMMIATDNMEAIEKYVSKKIDNYDKVGNTILLWAIRYDKLEIVNYLLEKKANPDIGSPIGEATKKYIKEQGIEDVDYVNSPLMIAVDYSFEKRPNKNEIIKSLLDAGANPNALNSKFVSAFQYALSYNSRVLKLLLERGANTTYISPDLGALADEKNFFDYFHSGFLLRDNGKTDVIDLLVEYDVKPDDMITNLMLYLSTEYKIYRFYTDGRTLKNHIKTVTYLLNKNYETMSINQFLTIIEYSIYIPDMNPHYGEHEERVKWFVDFFNALYKHKKNELVQLINDEIFFNKILLAEQKETGISAEYFKNFLFQLNTSILTNDKDWLDSYGLILE